jgi:hypothetical protein
MALFFLTTGWLLVIPLFFLSFSGIHKKSCFQGIWGIKSSLISKCHLSSKFKCSTVPSAYQLDTHPNTDLCNKEAGWDWLPPSLSASFFPSISLSLNAFPKCFSWSPLGRSLKEWKERGKKATVLLCDEFLSWLWGTKVALSGMRWFVGPHLRFHWRVPTRSSLMWEMSSPIELLWLPVISWILAHQHKNLLLGNSSLQTVLLENSFQEVARLPTFYDIYI